MAKEVFNRYEHKYILNKETFEKVIAEIKKHMEPDAYNKGYTPYTIANIYYDTNDNYLIRNSISHPEYKEKLRLRSYGIPTADSEVFLEIKKKFNGIVNKRRTSIKLNEAYSFLETRKSPPPKDYMNKQVMAELDFFIHHYNLSPKLYLAYDRIAFFEKGNPDLRVSFDTNIRSRRYDLKLEAGDYGESLLDENIYLMEIKTSLAKPLWLAHLLSLYNINRVHFSKYGTEFKRREQFKENYYGHII